MYSPTTTSDLTYRQGHGRDVRAARPAQLCCCIALRLAHLFANDTEVVVTLYNAFDWTVRAVCGAAFAGEAEWVTVWCCFVFYDKGVSVNRWFCREIG
jgi:hypothetical protein